MRISHDTHQELKSVMNSLSESEINVTFTLGDKDQSGGIDYQELIALMLPTAPEIIHRLSMTSKPVFNVKECFKKLDTNGNDLGIALRTTMNLLMPSVKSMRKGDEAISKKNSQMS